MFELGLNEDEEEKKRTKEKRMAGNKTQTCTNANRK